MASNNQKTAIDASVKGLALVKAAAQGNINEVTKLLSKKANVNHLNISMMDGKELAETPLMIAVVAGHAEVVKFLLARKANVNLTEPVSGYTALHLASQFGRVPMIELLMSKGAKHDMRTKIGRAPLHYAIEGHEDAAVYLLDHGADINAADDEGRTPLTLAAYGNHLPSIDLLLLRGADPNLCDKMGRTALQHAVAGGYLKVVQSLVDAGADVDKVGPYVDATPLIMAVTEGHLDIVKLLVLKGCDMKKQWKGLSALDIAGLSGNEEMVDFLINAGARFDEGGTVAKICKACGKDEGKMLRCEGCLAIHYCCVDCQKSDWKDHKAHCRNIKAMRDKYKDKGEVLKEVAHSDDFVKFHIEEQVNVGARPH